jgi:hypothetical protein
LRYRFGVDGGIECFCDFPTRALGGAHEQEHRGRGSCHFLVAIDFQCTNGATEALKVEYRAGDR